MKAIDIIPVAAVKEFIALGKNQRNDIWQPQMGYSREDLIRRRQQGETTYLYKMTPRTLEIWGYSDFKYSGVGLCTVKTLFRWQLVSIETAFAMLDAIDFDSDQLMVDALGAPVSEILKSGFYQEVGNFRPVEVSEPVEAVRTEVESSEVSKAVDDFDHKSEAEELREQLAAREAEVEKWRGLYEETMEIMADQSLEEEDNDEPAPVVEDIARECATRQLSCMKHDRVLSFFSGMEMVHLDWLWLVCILGSIWFSMDGIVNNGPTKWPLIALAVFTGIFEWSLGRHNKDYFKIDL